MSKLICLTTLLAVAVPGFAQTVEVELIIEAFDGAGCTPLDPPNCPVPHDLDGFGCNTHDGSTNNPSATYCSPTSGHPWPFPNAGVYGAHSQSLDQDWWNQGFPIYYDGDYSIKNGVEPENQASQRIRIGTPQNTLQHDGESINIGYISPETPQDQVSGFGRMLIEQIRQEYNTNHPLTPKGEPIANTPVYLEYDVMRVGDGLGGADPQNPNLLIRADQLPVWYNPVPAEAVWTDSPEADRMLPADGQWHTVRIGSWATYPEKVYMGIGFKIDNAAGTYPVTLTEDVMIYVDNVKIVYEALPADEVCDSGIDEDGDGLIDCDDPDCDGHPNCPCNRVLFADADFDLDVDQSDFAVLQVCYTGANYLGSLTKACECFDVAGPGGGPDGSVDQQDLAAFEICASGPEIMAEEACDD